MTELSFPGMGREWATGALVGAALYASCAVVLMVLGMYRIDGLNPWTYLIPAIAMALSSGIFEELFFRGVIFRSLEDLLGSWISLIVSSLLFGFVHLLNPGGTIEGAVFISVEAGLLLAAAYLVTRRLWMSIGFHMAWNYTQSGIFSGVVSGGVTEPGLIRDTIDGPGSPDRRQLRTGILDHRARALHHRRRDPADHRQAARPHPAAAVVALREDPIVRTGSRSWVGRVEVGSVGWLFSAGLDRREELGPRVRLRVGLVRRLDPEEVAERHPSVSRTEHQRASLGFKRSCRFGVCAVGGEDALAVRPSAQSFPDDHLVDHLEPRPPVVRPRGLVMEPFSLRALKPPVDLGPVLVRFFWSSRLANDAGGSWIRSIVIEAYRRLQAEAETKLRGDALLQPASGRQA